MMNNHDRHRSSPIDGDTPQTVPTSDPVDGHQNLSLCHHPSFGPGPRLPQASVIEKQPHSRTNPIMRIPCRTLELGFQL